MTKNLDKLAALLPEGLTEETLVAVNKLVTEAVEQRVGLLGTKVMGYLNVHFKDIKDSALRQLAEENQEFRKAKLMEDILESVALEVTPRDQSSALTRLTESAQKVDEANEVISGELNEALTENARLSAALQALHGKYTGQEKKIGQLEEALQTLAEQKKEPFKSSEKAVKQDTDGNVTATGADEGSLREGKGESQAVDNPFLTPEILELMPN